MISTGNDIIALKSTDPRRTLQEKFWAKILSYTERELYDQGAYSHMPFENFVWLLWSVKESVFKYQNRKDPDLLFSPGKIIIQNIDFPEDSKVTQFGIVQFEHNSFPDNGFFSCTVYFDTKIYYSRSKIYEDLIVTVSGTDESFDDTWWGVKFIGHTGYEGQSEAVRSFVLNKLNSIFPGDDLSIKKSKIGYPVLFKGSQEMNIPLSFSHHGNFVAYSFVSCNVN